MAKTGLRILILLGFGALGAFGTNKTLHSVIICDVNVLCQHGRSSIIIREQT